DADAGAQGDGAPGGLRARSAQRAARRGRRGQVPRSARRRQGHRRPPRRGRDRPRFQPRTPPAPRRRHHRPGPRGGIFIMSKPNEEAVIRAQLDKTLDGTNLPELGEKYEGKVRDSYVRDGRRTLIATDRISAFDVVLGTIPFKGQVLNQMAAFWFE